MTDGDDDGGTIALEDLEALPAEFKQAVQRVRRDLRELKLDIEHRRKRTATRDEMREQLAERWPDFYDELSGEAFNELILFSDVWAVLEEIRRENQARMAVEHPDGKWSLDDLRKALAKSKPEIYGRWDNTQLAKMLRDEGIPVVTIRIGNKTHKGVRKADIERLMQAREDRKRGVTRP